MLPTPLAAVQTIAGITERLDISNLDGTGLRAPAVMKQILGAVAFDERVIFVDENQPGVRVRFTDAHEAIHALCPWHRATLLTDTQDTLFREVAEQIELEANFGAAQLIFQGDGLHRLSAGDPPSLTIPIGLADTFGASLHAAIRFYAEEHMACVGLLVGGALRRQTSGNVPLFYAVESPSFRARFGQVRRLQPSGELVFCDGLSGPFAGILLAASSASGPVAGHLVLPDLVGRQVRCRAEAFCNQRNYFVMVTPV